MEVLVKRGQSTNRRHLLSRFPAYVGRGQDADVRLMDDSQPPSVSRRHLRLHVENERVMVTDVSTNGTWISKRQLVPGEPVAVAQDDPVWLGPDTMIVFNLISTATLPDEPDPEDAEATVVTEGGAAAPTVELRIDALGTFQAATDGRRFLDKTWSRRKIRVLLAFLADAGRPVSTDRLTELLWSESEESGRAALHSSIWRIRQAFRTHDNELPDPVQFDSGCYRLDPAYHVRLDVHTLEQLYHSAGRTNPADRLSILRQMQALYRGPFLEGCIGPWVEGRRQLIHGRYFEMMDDLARLLEVDGQQMDAARVLEELLLLEPAREDTMLALLRCLAALGRRDDARRRYKDFVRRLDRDLGPSEELVRLYQSL